MVQILPPPTQFNFATGTDVVANMVEIIGKAETKRRQILLNNRIMSIIAAGGSPEQIIQDVSQAVIDQGPEFDPGLAGFFQRLASPFAEPPGQELTAPLLSQALQQPTDIERQQEQATLEATQALTAQRNRLRAELTDIEKQQQQADLEATKALTERRRRGKVPTEIEKQQQQATLEATKALTERRKRVKAELTDIEKQQQQAKLEATRALTEKRRRTAKAKKPAIFKPSTLKDIRESVQAGIDSVEKSAISGFNAITQKSLIEAYKQKANEFGYSELSETQQRQFDAIWDKKARRKSTRFGTATDNATKAKIKLGWNKNSPEVRAARQELKQQTVTTKPFIEGDVRLLRPPDVRLEEFWDELPDEEKKEIIQRLNENPDNIEAILKVLQRG